MKCVYIERGLWLLELGLKVHFNQSLRTLGFTGLGDRPSLLTQGVVMSPGLRALQIQEMETHFLLTDTGNGSSFPHDLLS